MQKKKAFDVVTKKAYSGFYDGDYYNYESAYSKKNPSYDISYDDEIYSSSTDETERTDRKSVEARFSGWESASASTSQSILANSCFVWSYDGRGVKDEWVDKSISYSKTISEIDALLPYYVSGSRVPGKAGGYIEVTSDSYVKKTLIREGKPESSRDDFEGIYGGRVLTERNGSSTLTIGLMIDNGNKGGKFLITYASENESEQETARVTTSDYTNTLRSKITVYNKKGEEQCTLVGGIVADTILSKFNNRLNEIAFGFLSLN